MGKLVPQHEFPDALPFSRIEHLQASYQYWKLVHNGGMDMGVRLDLLSLRTSIIRGFYQTYVVVMVSST